jgi:hypothetical protein
MTFQNSTGYREQSNYCGLWCLLFGILYFAVKGCWVHVLVGLILALLTFGISWLVYPFFAGSIVRHSYLRAGWTEVNA